MVFDQIADDASFEWSATVTASLIDSVAAAISDYNPIHMSHVNAVEAGFSTRVFHGVGSIGLISAAVADNLPGPDSILLKIDSSFLKPAYLGDDLSL
jgi:acyl dehydratase